MPGDKVTDSAPRRILLVDCDMFFVQVARLEDPDGAGKEPLLIVGGSASGRGVVTSASYECRAFGVRSAMPTGRALELCPDAVVVGVSRTAVGERSRAVRRSLEGLSPVVQAASVDEFYLDLTGTERLYKGESLENSATRIRQAVLKESEISVSIGGGTNRLVAKLAARPAKPGGVFIVPPGGEADFVGTLTLRELPGIGPQLAGALKERGMVTVQDGLRVEASYLEGWLGRSRAEWLQNRMRGIASSEVEAGDPRKSISSERTFYNDIDDTLELERRLFKLTVAVAGQLRKQELQARTVTVKLKDRDFKVRQRSFTFPTAVESDRVLFPKARELLADLRKARRIGARLIGIGLGNLVDRDQPFQIGLFAETALEESEKERTLLRAVDGLRDRFGGSAVLPGGIIPRPGEERNRGNRGPVGDPSSLDGRDLDDEDS